MQDADHCRVRVDDISVAIADQDAIGNRFKDRLQLERAAQRLGMRFLDARDQLGVFRLSLNLSVDFFDEKKEIDLASR